MEAGGALGDAQRSRERGEGGGEVRAPETFATPYPACPPGPLVPFLGQQQQAMKPQAHRA